MITLCLASFEQCSHGDVAAGGFLPPGTGHMFPLAMAELCGTSISPKTFLCSDSSQGPTEAKHCVDINTSPINDLVAQEKCQRMVVALPSPCF